MSATDLPVATLDLPGALVADVSRAATLVAEWDAERRVEEADVLADVIASGADVLATTGDASRRATAAARESRNALILALAILAQRPEGVTFGALTWTFRGPTPDRRRPS